MKKFTPLRLSMEPLSLRGNALSSSSEEPRSLGEDDFPSYGEDLTGSVFLTGFRAEHLSNNWTPSVRLFGPDDLDIDSYVKQEYRWVINAEGYDTSLPLKDLKSALTNHFRSCGVVLSCNFEEDGRLASIVIVGNDADKKALELNGSEAGGGKLVVKAKRYPEIKPTPGIPFGATVSVSQMEE